MGAELFDFRDYGDSRDWSVVSDAVSEAGRQGAEASSKWHPERVAQVRASGRCDRFPPLSAGRGGSIKPCDPNAWDRVQIALFRQTIQDLLSRGPNYKQIRLLAACVAVTGKSFATHALRDLVRNLLVCDGESKVPAPTGVAAYQVGEATGRRLLRVHTG